MLRTMSLQRLFVLSVLAFAAHGAALAASTVRADFSVGADPPLLKDRANIYNTSIPSDDSFARDVPLLYGLACDSIRLEQAWGLGQSLSGTVDAASGRVDFDWAPLDRWMRLVATAGLSTVTTWDYTPTALADAPQAPPPQGTWGELVGRAVGHLRASDAPVLWHEVWNEPDYVPDFFRGTQEDYHRLYAETVQAIRRQDPDAKVGGPAIALAGWFESFLDYVRDQRLPLDFLSFHQYGGPFDDWVRRASTALDRDYRFATTEMLMDEYNQWQSFAPGPQDTFRGASAVLEAALRFSQCPALTAFHWAQFQDPFPDQHIGLVSWEGRARASCNGLRLWGLMPVDRKVVSVEGDALLAAASADEHRAGVLLVNTTGADRSVTVSLAGVPFARGSVYVYPIDAWRNSSGDGAGEALTSSERYPGVSLEGWSWRGVVPEGASVCLLIDDDSGVSAVPERAAADLVRINRYYPDRSSPSYSDFDRRTWIARQGMAGDEWADQQVGVTAERLPDVLTLACRVEGTLERRDANSLLGVRLDYATASGYAKSVFFHGPVAGGLDLYDKRRDAPFPFGTRRAADQVIGVADLASFEVWPLAYAPQGWTGRVDLTFLLQNAGPGARARWTVGRRSRVVRAIDCGSNQAMGAFEADAAYTGGTPGSTTRTVALARAGDPAPEAVYRTARHSRSVFSYCVGNLEPDRAYLLRLHFAEIYWQEPGRRYFDVSVNGRPLLERMDVRAAGGSDHIASVRELFVRADARGYLNIRLTARRDNAVINALEVCETLDGSALPR